MPNYSGSWTLQSQMQAQGASTWPAQFFPVYVEDVFSTYLYTGTAAAQPINNGIDLASKGGLVWTKARNVADYNILIDTVRGANNALASDLTNAQFGYGNTVTAFGSTGFTAGTSYNGYNVATWTFRKQPKFFDIVTYTGTGAALTLAHSLGSTPGCIIVKKISGTGDWFTWHRSLVVSLGNDAYAYLNNTAAATTYPGVFGVPTSTTFTVGADASTSASGATYVAYLFAHNAGGFGDTGTENVVSCGSFTTDGSGNSPVVNLGYEPQWLLVKQSGASGSWYIIDTMRGWNNAPSGSTSALTLYPNLSNAEAGAAYWNPTSTGFYLGSVGSANTAFIYIAIRRGPMKVPTDGAKVFNTIVRAGTGTATSITGAGFPPDFMISHSTNVGSNNVGANDKLRSAPQFLATNNTNAEGTISGALVSFDQDGFSVGTTAAGPFNITGQTNAGWLFRRAPSFFDEVCYTSTTGAPVPHNLGVVPELIINKSRNTANDWFVYRPSTSATYGNLNTTAAFTSLGSQVATATTYDPISYAGGTTYVTYLFATCPGVSKVGSYTGTGLGNMQQINCGFTTGARFVLIKRTDSIGDWYVWDSARGIVVGNDPYLLLNSTAAEVTTTDYIDTYPNGFEVSTTAPAALNATGGTYIFLAIA